MQMCKQISLIIFHQYNCIGIPRNSLTFIEYFLGGINLVFSSCDESHALVFWWACASNVHIENS